MKEETIEALTKISTNEKMFNSLYRNASSKFDLPDGRMWILYFLIFSKEDVTQLDIAERMMLPKQTVNSAASWLADAGYIKLEKIPGSKKKKMILTSAGKKAADATVGKLLSAECRAVERMGAEKIAAYISLYTEFYECMKQEFEEEGIIDA